MNEKGDSGAQYEPEEIKPYRELGDENEKGWDSWGSVVVISSDAKIERRSLYNDPEITRKLFTEPVIEHLKMQDKQPKILVDFGGGDGVMLHNINSQLKAEAGLPSISPVLFDIDAKKLESAHKEYPELNVQEGSVFSLPFGDNSIDVGVSRLAIQYFSGFEPMKIGIVPVFPYILTDERQKKDSALSDKNQYRMLSEIYRVLKPGGVLITMSPGTYSSDYPGRYINEFWNRVTAARTGESVENVRKERSFTSGYDLEHAAVEAGFKDASEHPDGEQIEWIEWEITPQAIFDRFGIDPNDHQTELTRQAILAVFNQIQPEEVPHRKMSDDYIPLPRDYFHEWKGQKAIKFPLQRIAFHKPKPGLNGIENHLVDKSGRTH